MAMRFGNAIKVNIYGESHSDEIGVEIDGFPAGERFSAAELQKFLARRAPGAAGGGTASRDFAELAAAASTPRTEGDVARFRSGVRELPGEELYEINGERISAYILNTNRRSGDYDSFRTRLRPGHADLGAYYRYGREGLRPGGGRFSGRMTAPLCIAGGIAKQLLAYRGVTVNAEIVSIGGETGYGGMIEAVRAAASDGDSVGGIVRCAAGGFPAGVGGALFDGLESAIAQAVFAIPAVKGIEFGNGFEASGMRGSENNDPIVLSGNEELPLATETNNHGGIAGGISTGMDIVFDVAIKPTPTIAAAQRTVDIESMTETELRGRGRHDACIVPRALPAVEAAAALALLDRLIYEESSDR